MTTTLTAARKSLLALVNTLPSPSTYADHAAVVADYLDNQVPLNIENKMLREQLAARGYTEGFGRIKPRGNTTNIMMRDMDVLENESRPLYLQRFGRAKRPA